jgi:hypothetical protein
MMRTLMAATAALFLMAGTAFASHCPKDAAAIDAALAKVEISDETRAEIVALRDQGMQLHEAGDHAESEEVLAEAMRMLLLALPG